METTIEYLGGTKFKASARGHEVICDQPVDNGGADEGMTPPEFLLASLGTCAGFYAAQYLRTRNLHTEGLHVRVTAEKATQPARLGTFRIEVDAPAAASDERHREGLMRAVKLCLVHNTLMHTPQIELVLNQPVAVPV
jgi:uncharacterized OsmC-like protein